MLEAHEKRVDVFPSRNFPETGIHLPGDGELAMRHVRQNSKTMWKTENLLHFDCFVLYGFSTDLDENGCKMKLGLSSFVF